MPERDLSRRLDMKSPDDVVCTLTRLRCVGLMNRTFWLVPGSFFVAIVTLPIRTDYQGAQQYESGRLQRGGALQESTKAFGAGNVPIDRNNPL
jgi:hypothetical protein